ncbi:hypothetical protein [Rickettsiella endosymbiont of Dermanyssus gallinae]|uniref:hypothetical protein n=1 Tax=Rickettsiella endosymbiont of Dermanyssus gallinae TaxID=2856608 RepID=UPI001C527908|nr:hypothetical protein [Rickettsiella endosymbiont of Dermanyssus gallinae]
MGVNALLQTVSGLLSTVLSLLPAGNPAAAGIQSALQIIHSVLAGLPATGTLPI